MLDACIAAYQRRYRASRCARDDLLSARRRVRRDEDPLGSLRTGAVQREALAEQEGLLLIRLWKQDSDTVTRHRMVLKSRLLEVHRRQLLSTSR